jgi:hypothetical protein
MLTFSALLAASNPLDNNPLPEAQTSQLFGLRLHDLLLILGVAVALGLVLFLWAYLTHKSRRRHHSSQSLSKPIYRAEKKSSDPASGERMRIRRKRRRHPDNLPRNPTLGETGGLPPIRPDDPPSELAQP